MTTKYENSPPPSDVEYEDDSHYFFTLSRPQSVCIRGFLSVDYSLIHPRLLGLESEEIRDGIIENKTNEDGQDIGHKDIDKDVNGKVKLLNVPKNEKPDFKTATDQNTRLPNASIFLEQCLHEGHVDMSERSVDMAMHKKKRPHSETESLVKMQGNPIEVLKNREYVSCGMKRQKCHTHHQLKRITYSADSDESDIIGTTVQDLRYKLISKSCSKKSKISHKNSDRKKPKLHKHPKICYKRRISVFEIDDHSSNSDRSKSDFYSRKTKRYRSISSDEEHSFPYRYDVSPRTSRDRRSRLRSPVIKVKQEVFSDDDKISYLGRRERLENDRFSEIDEGRNSKRCSPKREPRQEIKHEPMDSKDSKEFHGPGSFYCVYCKLTLNSELTWKSHLLGQRHAKAIRAQSVHEVARSSLLNPITSMNYSPVFEEGQRHNKPPPGMRRIELKESVASIQEFCDDLQYRKLVLGMRHVWEIRGEVETAYYCNICDAPCGPSSIMPHITGFKHRLMCLKEYFPQLYDRYKDAYKKTVEKIIEDKFSSHTRLFRKEKIRVFKDIPISDYRKSSTFVQDQPGPSRQTSFSQEKDETVIIKDDNGKPVVPSNQEFLDTKYADFHCTVCDSHMNNIAMWEAHIRGKRHLKNLKKDTEGVAATNKYIEAPPGTVSNLVKQIDEVCTSGEIIVGLKYIRENQGKNGNQYNCFPCGGCCSDIDIVDHILSMKHKIKYLEKMDVDGFKNSILEINNIQISNYYREQMVDNECIDMVRKYGRGKPKVYYIKRDLRFGQM